MSANTPFLGYVTLEGYHAAPTRLTCIDEIRSFLKEHLFDEQVLITDSSDELWFQALDGVDHFSRLAELGIDLPELYRQHRQELLDEVVNPLVDRQPWEDVYDQIGLSSGEIRMRQRVKMLVREARTISDVTRLIEGTYFDAMFCRSDGEPAWGYFDPQDFSVSPLQQEGLGNPESRIVLDPGARVKHIASGEDIHLFELIDLPF